MQRSTDGDLTHSDGMQCPTVNEANGLVKVFESERPDEAMVTTSDRYETFIAGEAKRLGL